MSEDAAGRARCTLHHHDRLREAVLGGLGGDPPACTAVPRHLAALAKVEPSAIERARWLHAGVTSAEEVAAWRVLGGPGTARRWLALGLPNAQEARHWESWDVDLDCAEAWVSAGVPLDNHIIWWRRLGVEHPDQTAPWIDAGVIDAKDAKDWAFAGIDNPDQVRSARAAGVVDGADAIGWWAAGAATELVAWRSAGVNSGTAALQWVRAGVSTAAEVTQWRTAGVTDGTDRAGWAAAGVAHPGQLRRWHRLGITTGAKAASWVRPRFVTGLEEIEACHDAGINDAQLARELEKRARLPAGVVIARRQGWHRLRGEWDLRDGRPRLVLPTRTGVTEVHFYAYGWSCHRHAATHWFAIDLCDGNEVTGSRRSGMLRHPNAEPWRTPQDPNNR